MFDFVAAGSGWPPIDHGSGRGEIDNLAARSKALAPCRITVDTTDLTCGDRVLELFDLCRGAFRDGGRHVVIDLHSVTRADTKIVACLIALYQIAKAASAKLEVCLSQAVVEIAQVCRLDTLVRELSHKPANAAAATSSVG